MLTYLGFHSSHLNRGKVPDTDISELSHYCGSEEDFVALQQYWFPEYYQTALEERFQVAADIVKTNRWSPSLFRLALSRSCIPKLAVHMRDRDGRTLLHVVAWVIGASCSERHSWLRDTIKGMSSNSTTAIPKYL